MRLPANKRDREKLFRNLTREIGWSRDSRAGAYRQWRTAYLTGTTQGVRARYNKLKEHVMESSADLYAPESVRFSPTVPRRYGDTFLPHLEVARDDFADLWQTSGADLEFSKMVEWAHVYPTTVGKVIVNRNRAKLVYIDPADVGVLQEEVTDWREQEAVCHWYTLSLSAFARMVRRAVPDETRQNELIFAAEQNAESVGNRVGDALPSALVLSQATPTMTGVVPGLPDVTYPLAPASIEPVIRMAELWVYDDEALVVICDTCGQSHLNLDTQSGLEMELYGHSFKAGTKLGEWVIVPVLLSTLDVLYEQVNTLTPGEHPFYNLSLEPVPFYTWGQSPLDALLALQTWHEDWLGQLRALFDLNANPPRAGIGLQGLSDEKMKILRAPGGDLPLPNSVNASIENMAPAMPPDGVDWLANISRMFSKMGGRPGPMSMQFDPSSRTGEQDLTRAMLGSGPTLTKAMRVEATLSSIATAMARLHWRVSPLPVRMPASLNEPEARRFLLASLPQDATMKVAAHSHSPVFQTQLMPKIAFAAQMGWMGAKWGLWLLNLPDNDAGQAEARQIQEIAAQRGAEIQKNKNLETQAKVVSAEAKMMQARQP